MAMAHEKLLFLDLDGVLHPAVGTFHQFRENCCRQLARVVAATRCRVVLSSSWRCYESSLQEATTALRRHGIELAGTTPEYDGHGARAREILCVVDGSGAAARWVALDDEDLVGGGEEEEEEGEEALSHFSSAATSARMAPHAVRTDADTGMTCANADRCIAILGREVAEEAVTGAGAGAAAGVDDHDHGHDHDHDRGAGVLDLV